MQEQKEEKRGPRLSDYQRIEEENRILREEISINSLRNRLKSPEEFRLQLLILKEEELNLLKSQNKILDGIGMMLSNLGQVLENSQLKQESYSSHKPFNKERVGTEEYNNEDDDLLDQEESDEEEEDESLEEDQKSSPKNPEITSKEAEVPWYEKEEPSKTVAKRKSPKEFK